MKRKSKIRLISLAVVAIILIGALLINGINLRKNRKIIVLSEESCDYHNYECNKTGVIDSHWQGSNLIIEGVFPVNCCPGKILYEYNLTNNNLNVILKDKGLCNCMNRKRVILEIKDLKRGNYNISLGYGVY